MKMLRSRRVFLALLALSLFFAFGCAPKKPPTVKPSPSAPPTVTVAGDITFSIIYTSNLSGNAIPWPYGELCRDAPRYHFTQIQEIARRLKGNPDIPLLMLDCGNSMAGWGDFNSFFRGKPQAELMKDAGYMAAFADSRCPESFRLHPEIFVRGSDGETPVGVKILQAGDVKVSVFFLEHMEEITDPDTHPAAGLEEIVKKHKSPFNILICRVRDLPFTARMARGIDLIIPGNYHDILDSSGITTVEGIPAAPFVDSQFILGKIDIQKGAISAKAVPGAGADPRISGKSLKILKPYITEFNRIYTDNYPVIMSSALAVGEPGLVHTGKDMKESPVASFAADVIRRAVGAEIAIINHGAVSGDLAGIITAEDIRRAFPFDNQIITMDLTGAQLKKILSANSRKGDEFYQVSGITLAMDPQKQETAVCIEGEPLKDETFYRTALPDYLSNSEKEKHSEFKKGRRVKNTGIILNHAIADELLNFPLISVPPPRMDFAGEFLTDRAQRLYKESAPKPVLAALKEELASASGADRNPIRLKMARCMISSGNMAGAEKTLIELLSEDPAHREASLLSGLIYYGSGRVDEASELLEKAPADSLSGGVFLGLAYYRQGKINKARAHIRQLSAGPLKSPRLSRLYECFPNPDAVRVPSVGKPIWPTFKENFSRTGRTSLEGPLRGRVAWKFKTYRPVQSAPAVGPDGSVRCSSGDGFLYSISSSGVLKWKIRLGKSLLASPTVDDRGMTYQGSDDGNLYCIDGAGKIRWQYKTGKWIVSSAAVDKEGRVFFGSNDNFLYCLNSDGKLLWKTDLKDQVFSSPALDGKGNVLVGSLDGNLYCLSGEGKIKWSFKTGGKVYSSPAIADDGRIYAGSDDGFIYCIDPMGRPVWKFKTGGFVPSSPAIDEKGRVYVGSEDHSFYCISSKGKKIWSFKTRYEIFGSPVIDKAKNIYFGSDDTFIYCLNPKGKLIWKIKTEKYVESTPALGVNGQLYIGSDDGHIYCIR